MEHTGADPLASRFPAILITGGSGQLGTALAEVFPTARTAARAAAGKTPYWQFGAPPDLVLHAGAWTDVDGAEADPEGAMVFNATKTQELVSLGVPVVYFSSDYVFDGTKREPYVESDDPRPINAYGRSKLAGEREIRAGWIVRSSWLFGWTGHNFLRTMLELGSSRKQVAVVGDQRGCPTYVGHLAQAARQLLELPHGLYHVAASGECSWAEFAAAIFEEAGLSCRVVPLATAELGRPAPRPAYSVLRSERGAPTLPHWREGLRACLKRLL